MTKINSEVFDISAMSDFYSRKKSVKPDPDAVLAFKANNEANEPDVDVVTLETSTVQIPEIIDSQLLGRWEKVMRLDNLRDQTAVTLAIKRDPTLGTTVELGKLFEAIKSLDQKKGPTTEQQAIFDKYGLSDADVARYRSDTTIFSTYQSRGEDGAAAADEFLRNNPDCSIEAFIDEDGKLILKVTSSSDTPEFFMAMENSAVFSTLDGLADTVQNQSAFLNNIHSTSHTGFRILDEYVTEDGATNGDSSQLRKDIQNLRNLEVSTVDGEDGDSEIEATDGNKTLEPES